MPESIEIDRRAIYQIHSAAAVCDLSTEALRSAIKAGDLPATVISRRTFIDGDSLWRWLAGRPHHATDQVDRERNDA